MFEIEVSFVYEIPFDGEGDGPESEKIQAGENETFTLTIENIDVFDFAANSVEEMKITASLVTRAGVQVLIPENQEAMADLKIPTIYSILVDIDLVWSHIKSLYKLSDNVLIKRLDALMFTKKQILSEI